MTSPRLRFIRILICSTFLLMGTATAAPAVEPSDPELRAVLMTAVEISDSFEDRYEAEVWLTDMSARLARKIPDPVQRVALLRYIHREATRAGLAPNWFWPSSRWKATSIATPFPAPARWD